MADSESNPADRAPEPADQCPHCLKPGPLCICDSIAPVKNRISLLILQHPQEQDRALGTARLTALHFTDATLRVGLSWASLSKALGRPIANPARWAVLYLGSARPQDVQGQGEVIVLSRNGKVAEGQRAILQSIEGVVLLDGTWSQAKALWWRNPWMLKCQRIILNPSQPSRYGRLRREPRPEGLSTIEAAATIISTLEKRREIASALNASFERMLNRYRAVQAAMPELAPRPARRNRRHLRGRKKPQ